MSAADLKAGGPPDIRVLGLLALAALVPTLLGGIGAHDMFTAPVEYRLEVLALEADDFPTRISPVELAPHLTRDARRVILPAHGWALGENGAAQLVRAIPDLMSFVCALRRPHAVRVIVRRRTLRGEELPEVDRRQRCVHTHE